MVSLTPPDNFFGTVSAKIGVFDGISTAIEYLSILVEPVNDPPSINETIDWEVHSENVTIKPDRIIVLEDQFVNITVIASDIDDNNSKLVINAQSNSTKAGMFYLNSTNGQFKFLAENSDVGIYYLNFSVNDTHDQNNLAWREVIIDILDVNDPPILLVSNEKHVATVGKTFEYEIIGYDNDPFDSLKFTDDTHLFDIDPISGLIKFKPKNSQIGKHQITITITDKNGNESISKIFSLEINSKPEDPLSSNYIIICPIILVCIILAFFIQERLSHRSRSDIKAADKQKVKANQKNDRVDADDQKAEKEIDIENIQEIND